MSDYLLEYEARQRGANIICGVDEVGRGPLAGPVMAAAAIIPLNEHGQPSLPGDLLTQLNDSKQLSAKKREAIFEPLIQSVDYATAEITPEEIDEINILQATLKAMAVAVSTLRATPDLALVDGNKIPPALPCAGQAVVKGDSQSLSIAAASIIAKVLRDRLMAELAQTHPGYGWDRNAGYGTAEHRDAITRLGLTPHHRRSFCRNLV